MHACWIWWLQGAIESISVGEIRLSLRQSLVKLGVGFMSRDPKLQVLICDLEIVIRSSKKGPQKARSRKSRSSGRGKWMVLGNMARFLSVSISDLVLKVKCVWTKLMLPLTFAMIFLQHLCFLCWFRNMGLLPFIWPWKRFLEVVVKRWNLTYWSRLKLGPLYPCIYTWWRSYLCQTFWSNWRQSGIRITYRGVVNGIVKHSK